MKDKLNNIITLIKELTFFEGNQLILELEKYFSIDVNTHAVSNLNTNKIADLILPETKEEKTAFDVILEEVPSDKKITVLKIIRNLTGLGLKECKDIVDNVPKILKLNITKEESNNIKKEIELVGGKVTIK